MVRINQLPDGLEDLEWVVPHNVHVILIPKCEGAHQVVAVGTVHFNNSGSLVATFDLMGVPPGDYELVVEQPGGALTSEDFSVTTGTGGSFFARLLMPSFVRVGRP